MYREGLEIAISRHKVSYIGGTAIKPAVTVELHSAPHLGVEVVLKVWWLLEGQDVHMREQIFLSELLKEV